MTYRSILIAVAATICTSTPALAETCDFGFDLQTTVDFGTLAKGTSMRGNMSFTASDSMKLEGGVRSFPAVGSLTFGSADVGQMTAGMRAFHVARTDRMLDYYAVDATHLTGKLGGFDTFYAPVLIAFYGAGGTLENGELPKDATMFEALDNRRTLHLQTPNGKQVMMAKVFNVTGGCKP